MVMVMDVKKLVLAVVRIAVLAVAKEDALMIAQEIVLGARGTNYSIHKGVLHVHPYEKKHQLV